MGSPPRISSTSKSVFFLSFWYIKKTPTQLRVFFPLTRRSTSRRRKPALCTGLLQEKPEMYQPLISPDS